MLNFCNFLILNALTLLFWNIFIYVFTFVFFLLYFAYFLFYFLFIYQILWYIERNFISYLVVALCFRKNRTKIFENVSWITGKPDINLKQNFVKNFQNKTKFFLVRFCLKNRSIFTRDGVEAETIKTPVIAIPVVSLFSPSANMFVEAFD